MATQVRLPSQFHIRYSKASYYFCVGMMLIRGLGLAHPHFPHSETVGLSSADLAAKLEKEKGNTLCYDMGDWCGAHIDHLYSFTA